ncbi:Metallo-dependent phosphatase-like protein [Amylostereum chailletii]|nr:Metallo-dependent phosphatase-like protein [Amylostereum chailletii]
MSTLTFPDGRRRLLFLQLTWIAIVLWCEAGVFIHSTSDCRWPEVNAVVTPEHVLIIADPQILDEHSYPGRNPWFMSLSQFIVDMNIRKAWRVARSRGPDAVVMLGDMMDNGRADMSHDEYRAYVARFMHIFSTRKRVPRFYLPGNHDVGLGGNDHASSLSRTRYKAFFGPTNQHTNIGNHTVILIDAPQLVEDDYQRAVDGEDGQYWMPKQYTQLLYTIGLSTNAGAKPKPLILFSHIPLSRPHDTDCGPLREKGTLRAGHGIGYENTLSETNTRMLLRTFRPALIFSGDDHDYCEYTHKVPLDDDRPMTPTSVQEVTVKSISMAMGIKRPGFHLLSLASPAAANAPTFAHRPCLLPDQLGIYLWTYLPLFVLTTLVIFAHSALVREGDPRAPSYERTGTMDAERGAQEEKSSFAFTNRWRATASGFVSQGRERLPLWLTDSKPRHDMGFLRRFIGDFGTVAWPALLLYAVIVLVLFW